MNFSQLTDTFGREIKYLRLSITDRCDFRCTYCMAEDMTFLPRSEVLTLEELVRLSATFVELGVSKIRVTGGEPLVRKDAIHLLRELGKLKGLEALCLTTNGSKLLHYADDIKDAGVSHVNVSIDSLKPERFAQLTRHGKLNTVLDGIKYANNIGFTSIKLNTVLMRNYNFDETLDLCHFALEQGVDISFIEEMPLGNITSHQRSKEFISSKEIRRHISKYLDLRASTHSSGGPARYWEVDGYSSRIGFISPHSENFCSTCNRVRVTAAGKLLLCLGNEHSLDLKTVLRQHEGNEQLKKTLIHSMNIKPEKHEFDLNQAPQIIRFMNTTGG